MPKTYRVSFTRTFSGVVDVEAENDQDAADIAERERFEWFPVGEPEITDVEVLR